MVTFSSNILPTMADRDELYYLEPGFDLATLTVPRLRSILVAHEINYPSSAKKGDLIEIVEDQLLPQARKLLRQRDRVRRTSRGITDVPSSQESNVEDESEREMPPPPPPTKTPRGRKSRSDLQDQVEPTPKTTRRSKTPTSRKTVKAPRVSESETDTMVSTRKPRKSTADPVAPTPATNKVSRKSRDADESPFTQDNPFQQGSSPISDSKTAPSTSRTRKSIGGSTARKSSSRRRTGSPTRAKREEFEIPISHLSTGADNVEVTEEFTEDARHELARDMQTDRRVAKARSNAILKRKKPQSTAAKTASWSVLGLVFTIVTAWYRQEKVAVGYCGVGQAEWSLADVENVPVWVNDLGPQCEPCPNHATCYPGMKAECDHDFVLREHPLSLNGIVPLPPTCEPDSAKEKKIEIVTKKAIHELRENTAEHECGTSNGKQGAATIVSPVKLGLYEEELKERVAAQRRKGLSDDEFEDLWSSALGAIKARDEVELKEDK